MNSDTPIYYSPLSRISRRWIPRGRSTVAALRKMQIKVTETKREENKELITARAADRDIDIEIEALTPNTTRLTVVAKKDGGFIRDSATATEIILQTEKLVGTG